MAAQEIVLDSIGEEIPGQLAVDTAAARGRFAVGVVGVLGVPVGEFGDAVDIAGGLGGFGVLFLDDQQRVGLRLDASWLIYGRQAVRTPFGPPSPFVDLRTTTENGIVSAGFGPQLSFRTGALRPYLRGSVGLSYFFTRSSIGGTANSSAFAATTNLDDMTYTLSAGGGLRVALLQARGRPVELDMAASYSRSGMAQYLTEGDLRVDPSGLATFDALRSATGLLMVHVGLTIGMR